MQMSNLQCSYLYACKLFISINLKYIQLLETRTYTYAMQVNG